MAAGILLLVSDAWRSKWFPPESALSPSSPYAGWYDCRPLFDRGFTLFIVRHGSREKFALREIVDDLRCSVRLLRVNAEKYGVDPERLGVIGAGSGGYLAKVLATTSDEGVPNPRNHKWLCRYSDRVAAAVAYSPSPDVRSGLAAEQSQEYEAVRLKVIQGAGPGLATDSDTRKTVGEASLAWFEKFLLARDVPKTEVRAAERITPASAPKVTLSQRYVFVDLATGPVGPWPVAELESVPADLLTNDTWRTTKILLRRIPAGAFTMGSPPNEVGRGSDEPCTR